MSTTPAKRLFILDLLRAASIISMVVFHFCYDLDHFDFVDWNTPNGEGFWQWRYTILFGFIFSMGTSISLGHYQVRHYKRFAFWCTKIAICAAILTGISLIISPKSWIYFGILHFMLIAGIIAFVFTRMKWLSATLGTAIIISSIWSRSDGGDGLYWFPFEYSSFFSRRTLDYAPLFPWVGVALIGTFTGAFIEANQKLKERLLTLQAPKVIAHPLRVISSKSLIIYMIHQPILQGILSLILYLKK